VTTTNATLTDALLEGHLRAVSDGIVVYDDNIAPQSVRTDAQGVHIDVGDTSVLDFDDGGLHATARLERATIVANPAIELDLRIRSGAAAHMAAVVESDLDADVAIAFEARGSRTQPATVHTASVPLYTSPIVPLPERRVGPVPIAPEVQFLVTLDCAARFDGVARTSIGLHVNGHARLSATYANGAWSAAPAPIQAVPRVSFDHPGPLFASCALTTHATLGAYAIGGVTMTFAPFVELAVDAHAADFGYAAHAGTQTGVAGDTNVFGITAQAPPVERWSSPTELIGTSRWPGTARYLGY
jgi:hypothetical protein